VEDDFVSNSDDAHDSTKAQYILDAQMGFWQDDKSMIEAGERLKINVNNVPTLLIIGANDKNVPFEVTKLVKLWATRTIVVGGSGHELCDTVDGISGTYHDYIPDIDRFLDYCMANNARGA
jgi:pimeloyl-ACP methyl ester carboxylesterase